MYNFVTYADVIHFIRRENIAFYTTRKYNIFLGMLDNNYKIK